MSDTTSPQDLVADSLPLAIRRAVDNYDRFSAAPPPSDAKEFTAFQSGCKAALAHLESLLKLVDQACPAPDSPADAGGERAALADLVREARTAVARLKTAG